MWMSWTDTTPSTARMCSRIIWTSTPLGVASRSTSTTSRSRCQARGRIISAISDRGDGVRGLVAGGHDDDGGDNDGEGAQQVAQDFQVRAADVEAFLLGAAQDQQRDQVGDRAQDGGEKHDVGLDLGGRAEAPDGLGEDDHGNDDQDQRVGQRGQDLGPLVAVGPRIVRRTRGNPGRQQRDEDAGGVGEHVPGVGQQGQRAGDQGTHNLDQDHRQGDAQHGDQALAVLPGRRDPVRVAVVVSHASKASPTGGG